MLILLETRSAFFSIIDSVFCLLFAGISVNKNIVCIVSMFHLS